jgi:arylsulfatase A-like enzyme
MIIITSDHGELFGEDGLFYHALSIRQELIHVPLIIKYPEQEEGEKIEEPVSLLDISPTILRASGVDLSGKDFDGVPLQEGGTNIPLSELGEPKEERIEDLEEKGVNAEKYNRGAKTAQNKEYKLLKYSDGEEKLIEKSSGQEADKPQVKERLSEEIEEKLSGFWTGGDEIKVEEEVKEELEKLGYF